ncbi:MAG: PD40 domain-containing protein [Flavobacteriales bacterium]|nr:PD40 domain-containing protein [Flavobacteriales bacterium]
MLLPFLALAQGGDQQVRAKADQLFLEQRFAEAMPLYSQLVSLTPGDRNLNYRFGACLLFGNADKEPAISHLRFATDAPNTEPMAWYWLGRAYHLNYRFKEAQVAYQRFLGTAEKKLITEWPVEALMRQCRNGERLLSSLKEISVRSKVEVEGTEFFRFYDLSDIGGKIVVLPEELMSSLDKKRKERSLVYLPERGGPIYFSSYGKDGVTGRDIYRSELVTDGTFATPTKLAGYINTDQDEDFPFMHPDGKTFYFSSKGHNSMGGYDVFRASYDRGLDAFGRPENLDFAVSTPDDDIFYIVDGEQKEACFASGRNSRQGMLHVYRVATAQLPVVITVFKGTYASSIDPEDRKAQIVVEDMLTQERVADVRTDINGSYVLSVPRAGRYRYMVTCGPTGRTHGGVVEVPKADGPRAYRQELVLERKGDLEQLTIRNYFDDPLGEDLIALNLEEIKRRARLDVSDRQIVAQVPVEEQPTGDVMTRAGFTGDIDQAAAVRLARDDARELEAQAMEWESQSAEAFALAIDATQEAERAATKADDLIKSAANAEEPSRTESMTEAARQRQRSREAGLRARAAFNTGQSLRAAAIGTRQQALQADRLATDLASATTAAVDDRTLPLLQTLKQRMDEKSRPDPAREPAEQARKLLVDQEKESARLLSVAQSKRAEENELSDRVARLKREQDETRSRSRKDEITRDLNTLDPQLLALRQETVAAFNRAAATERQTAVLRGQSSLTRHLTQSADRGAGSELSAAQAEQLGLRISGADQRAAALAIDERFEAQLASDAGQSQVRTFDWDLVSAAEAIGEERQATRTAERDRSGEASQTAGRTGNVSSPDDGERSTVGTRTIDPVEPGRGSVEQEERSAAQQPATVKSTEGGSGEARGTVDAAGNRDQAPSAATTSPSSEADRFVLENERAELSQLIPAERNRTRRDSMQARIASIDARLAQEDEQPALTAEDAGQEPPAMDAEVDLTRPVAVFTSAAKDEEVVAQVYQSYASDRSRAERMPDADQRADAISGVELMLADSLRAEMQRQVAVLQLSPQQAEVVLPRVNRLRRLREDHIAQGEQAIAERQAELQELALRPDDQMSGHDHDTTAPANGKHPINDRFIVIDRYARNVFASTVEHRSRAKGVSDAIAFRDADVARIDDLSTRIDSMEQQLAGMALGKESDKLRKKADQLIDERYIIRTDLGQRSAFLMKEEWRTAADSLKRVEAMTASRGLAPDEPLVQMAKEYSADARQQFDDAVDLRKRADRIEDIVARDSLYRRAYRNELLALQAMDRAITVQNHLASPALVRGERMSYEEVAAKVLGIDLREVRGEELAQDGAIAPVKTVMDPPAEQAAVVTSDDIAQQPDVTTESAVESRTNEAAIADDAPVRPAERPLETDQQRTTVAESTPAATSVQDLIQQAEQRLAAKDRVPAQLYERYLTSESTVVSQAAIEPGLDPNLLTLRVERGSQESADMEKRSMEAADRAVALADSAAKARKRDREELEALAVRERQLSDSLHAESQRVMAAAQASEQLRQEAEVAKGLRERLLKFYYLTPEEQQMVLLEGDASRYFQARARALEQYEVAGEAANAASSNREVALVMRQQARAAEREATNGRAPAADASQRAAILDARAATLEQKADSLENVASRLRGAASINESQASVMLQGLPAERSSEIMAMEQRARRSESLLAESRDEAGQQRTDEPVRMVRPATQQRDDAGDLAEAPQPPTLQPSTLQPSTLQPSTLQPSTLQPSTLQPSTSQPSTAQPFRMPDELAEDLFELRAVAESREAPIPLDAAMPQGIVYKVQIGAFRKPIPQQAFSDMSPVMGETVGNGLVRYTAGLFTGFNGAAAAKDLVRERGYRDAFVVAYRDGKRIPLGEAMRASAAQPAIAAAQRPSTTDEQAQRMIPPARTTAPVAATIERPATAVNPTTAEDAATVLMRYPSTAKEIVDGFTPAAEAASYYNEPGAAPARQVETVKGLFFTVQVGVYSKPVPLGRLFNITPLNSELTETAKVRYTTGHYTDTEQARVRKDEAVALGVKDAFMTAYLNGKRIPVREGVALLEKFGPEILAKP